MDLGKIDFKKQKFLIFIIIVVLLAFYFGKKIWISQEKKTNTIKNKITDFQSKIDLAQDIKTISKNFEKYDKTGWETKESVVVMGKINEFASKYDIEIFTFDPTGLVDRGEYYILFLSLNIRADYFNLSRFLLAIEEFESLTKIKALNILAEKNIDSNVDSPMVKANLSIEAFILKK